MSENTQLAKPKTAMPPMTRFKQYLRSEEVMSRFKAMLGSQGAERYVMEVYLTVMNSERLQECTPESIVSAALRSAALKLSVDPVTGHAYLVPYGHVCTMLPGYKGYMWMGERTGKYRYINVSEIYEGQVAKKELRTGFWTFTGEPISKKVIGYYGSFELVTGLRHDVYWTVEQIYAHAQQYSPGYRSKKADNPWFASEESKAGMEKKTVIRDLMSHWGYMEPHDAELLQKLDQEPINVVDGEFAAPAFKDVHLAEGNALEGLSEEQIKGQLGFEPDPAATPAEVLAKEKEKKAPKTVDLEIQDGKIGVTSPTAGAVLSAFYDKPVTELTVPELEFLIQDAASKDPKAAESGKVIKAARDELLKRVPGSAIAKGR